MVGLLTFPLSLLADRFGRVRSLVLMAVVCLAGVAGGVWFSLGITRRLDEAVQLRKRAYTLRTPEPQELVALGDLVTATVTGTDGVDLIAHVDGAAR